MDENASPQAYETKRLERVAEFCPPDQEGDEAFEKIVAMTAAYFDAPIALGSVRKPKKYDFL